MYDTLEYKQKHDLRMLLNSDRDSQKNSLLFPLEDEDALYFLGYGEEFLLSAAVLCMIDGEHYEYIAFTHPLHRRKGYFKEVWHFVISSFPSKRPVYIDILSDETCTAAALAANSLGAYLFSVQLYMYFELAKTAYNFNPEKFLILPEAEDNPYAKKYVLYLCPEYTKAVASFFILSFDKGKTAYFYAFEIHPPYRGRGMGKSVLNAIQVFLKKEGYQKMELQLDASNIPACTLYKNTGFQIKSSISYHRIQIS